VPGKKPSYILPAKIGIWAIYAIAVRQRDRFDLPQLTCVFESMICECEIANGDCCREFAKMLMREAQSRGMQMENPAECEVLPSDQKTITNKVQIAAKHGAQFIFFVQHDHLKIHSKQHENDNCDLFVFVFRADQIARGEMRDSHAGRENVDRE
jgi:hypothetical protein